MTPAKRAECVRIARSWIGTPYHHQGAIRGSGVDCAQLIIAVYAEAGIIDSVDVGFYPQDWHLHRTEERYLEWMARYADQVKRPLPGDVAMFRMGHTVSHSGLVTDWPMIVHAYYKSGVIESCSDDAILAGRFHSFWRVR